MVWISLEYIFWIKIVLINLLPGNSTEAGLHEKVSRLSLQLKIKSG